MILVPDTRLLTNPRLLKTWSADDSRRVQFDYNHWMLDRIAYLFMFDNEPLPALNDPHFKPISRGIAPIRNNHRIGKHVNFAGVDNAERIDYPVPSKILNAPEFTFAAITSFPDTSKTKAILAAHHSNGSFYVGFTTSTNFRFMLQTNLGRTDMDITFPTYIDRSKTAALVAIYDGAKMRVFIDGREIAPPLAKTGTLLNASSVNLYFGNYSGGGYAWRGKVFMAGLYTRAWSENEAKSFALDPYQFLKPTF